mmetsp:Transcript_11141/g.15628  ORF Transcript_11141/g.15628 Transcript_11141/m.15628 type:complete len:277 (+) Transcript_11141:279-1109(+)
MTMPDKFDIFGLDSTLLRCCNGGLARSSNGGRFMRPGESDDPAIDRVRTWRGASACPPPRRALVMLSEDMDFCAETLPLKYGELRWPPGPRCGTIRNALGSPSPHNCPAYVASWSPVDLTSYGSAVRPSISERISKCRQTGFRNAFLAFPSRSIRRAHLGSLSTSSTRRLLTALSKLSRGKRRSGSPQMAAPRTTSVRRPSSVKTSNMPLAMALRTKLLFDMSSWQCSGYFEPSGAMALHAKATSTPCVIARRCTWRLLILIVPALARLLVRPLTC